MCSAEVIFTGGTIFTGDPGLPWAGCRADLAVLDRDPFTGPDDKIAKTRVLATYVDGRPVF